MTVWLSPSRNRRPWLMIILESLCDIPRENFSIYKLEWCKFAQRRVFCCQDLKPLALKGSASRHGMCLEFAPPLGWRGLRPPYESRTILYYSGNMLIEECSRRTARPASGGHPPSPILYGAVIS